MVEKNTHLKYKCFSKLFNYQWCVIFPCSVISSFISTSSLINLLIEPTPNIYLKSLLYEDCMKIITSGTIPLLADIGASVFKNIFVLVS